MTAVVFGIKVAAGKFIVVFFGPEVEFMWYGIIPALGERIAAKNPPKSQISALNRPKTPNSNSRILGTAWMKAAARR